MSRPVSLVARKKNRNRLAWAINSEWLPATSPPGKHAHNPAQNATTHRKIACIPFCMYDFRWIFFAFGFGVARAFGQTARRQFIPTSIFIVDRINFWLDKKDYKNKFPSRIATAALHICPLHFDWAYCTHHAHKHVGRDVWCCDLRINI